mmetsp:Transcript_134634/g.429991  ORF Transcript_134634/g.429991 Transcript_134634/m.429991 type:complete len:153 (+) Transcript_134634:137-595(+)
MVSPPTVVLVKVVVLMDLLAASLAAPLANMNTEAPPCADVDSVLIQPVIRVAPQCFRQCPQVCRPVAELLELVAAHANSSVLEHTGCSFEQELQCLYGEPSCKVLLVIANSSMDVPETAEELRLRCADLAGNQTTSTSTTSSTTTATTAVPS